MQVKPFFGTRKAKDAGFGSGKELSNITSVGARLPPKTQSGCAVTLSGKRHCLPLLEVRCGMRTAQWVAELLAVRRLLPIDLDALPA